MKFNHIFPPQLTRARKWAEQNVVVGASKLLLVVSSAYEHCFMHAMPPSRSALNSMLWVDQGDIAVGII